MFGRTVEVDGVKIFVLCFPETPLSDVLIKASHMRRRDEVEEARNKRNKEIADMLEADAIRGQANAKD